MGQTGDGRLSSLRGCHHCTWSITASWQLEESNKILDPLEAVSHLGLSPPGTTGTCRAKGGRQVSSHGRGCGVWWAGLALRELGTKLGVGDAHADEGREEVCVQCESGNGHTGAEGKIRGGEESCRGEVALASRHAGYKV